MLDGDRVLTQYPALGDAQAAGMSTTEYREFVREAVTRDWDDQREFHQPLIDRLDDNRTVRVTSTDTDLRFSVDGMRVGEGREPARVNLPDGEVGTIEFDGDVVYENGVFRWEPQFSG